MTEHVTSPTHISRGGWWRVAKAVWTSLARDHVSLVAAGVAFFGLLALFPGLAACMAIAGLVTEPATVVEQLRELGNALPQQAAEIIVNQASEVAGSSKGGLGLAALIGLAITWYSASRGIANLIEGLNAAYGESESRGFVRLQGTIFALTLFVVIGVIIAIFANVAVPAVLAAVRLGGWEPLIAVATYGVMLLLTIGGLAALYRFGPDRKPPRWRWITPGAGIAAIGWFAGSLLFGWYVTNFGSYNETFGTLGGVVVLLTWMWLSAFIVLLGAEIDEAMEAEAGAKPAKGLE